MDLTEGRRSSAVVLATATAVLIALQGCSAVPRESPLPHDGPTMMDIYRGHTDQAGDDGAQAPRNRIPARPVDADEVTSQRRALSDSLNNRFERLPNPDLAMTVFPHIAPGNYPVPGYQTVFPMYESVQYALPGEVAPRHRAGDGFVEPPSTTGRMIPAAAAGSSSSELQRQAAAEKATRLATIEAVSPPYAQGLRIYDQLHTDLCKSELSADDLLAVAQPGAAGNAIYRDLVTQAAAGRPEAAKLQASKAFPCEHGLVASKSVEPMEGQ